MSLRNSIIRVLNGLARRSYWYKEIVFKDCYKFWNHREFGSDLELVNLGSGSGKYAFNYDGLDVKASNWAMEGQTFIGDHAILSNYLSYLKREEAVVIITLCPFSSLGEGNPYLPDKFYTIVCPMTIPNFALERKDYFNQIKQNPYAFIPATQVLVEIKRRLFRKAEKDMTPSELQQHAGVRMKSWMRLFSITDLKDSFSLANKDRFYFSVKAFDELIEECKKHNFIPVVVLPPVSKYLSSYFDESFRQRYIYDYLDSIRFKDIHFFNYLDDVDFLDDSLYRTSLFMNEKGAKKFTKRVVADLKEAGIINHG